MYIYLFKGTNILILFLEKKFFYVIILAERSGTEKIPLLLFLGGAYERDSCKSCK